MYFKCSDDIRGVLLKSHGSPCFPGSMLVIQFNRRSTWLFEKSHLYPWVPNITHRNSSGNSFPHPKYQKLSGEEIGTFSPPRSFAFLPSCSSQGLCMIHLSWDPSRIRFSPRL